MKGVRAEEIQALEGRRSGVSLGAADGPQARDLRRELLRTPERGTEARMRGNLSGL